MSLTIGITWLGYVGLPLALSFAESGAKVLGFDIDPQKIELLGAGESYIRHIGAERIASAVKDGTFAATTEFSRVAECDAVLLSDYGSGLVTPDLALAIRRAIEARTPRRNVPIVVDSRYRLLDFKGLTACTPNESEVEQALDVEIDDDPDVLEKAGRTLLRRTGMQAVLITRGGRGMALFQPKQQTVHIPIHGSDEVADVTGAGDTVIATLASALAAGASFEDASHLANFAGGLVVLKRGTATVSAAELTSAVEAGA